MRTCLAHLFEQPQIEQLVLLTPDEGQLTVQLSDLLTAFLLLTTRPLTQNPGEPIADLVVLDTELVEETEHLLVEVGFGQADT